MGTIFDAMNRFDGDDHPDRQQPEDAARPSNKPQKDSDPEVLHTIRGDASAQSTPDPIPFVDNSSDALEALENLATLDTQNTLNMPDTPDTSNTPNMPGASDAPDTSDTPETFAFNAPIEHGIQRAPGAKGVGQVSIDLQNIDDRLVAMLEPASIMSEEYRSIRTGILARWNHKRQLIHTITSATPQEGKTITSLNLGLSFGELRNRRTIVVEADLRLPQFTKLLCLPPDQPGMLGLLRNEIKLKDAVIEVGDSNLHMIVAGGHANDQAVQMIHSGRMVKLLQQLRQQYDHVIIDTPPVVELADAGILGAMSDDVLLIVRMGRTPKPLVEQAIRTLSSYNAPVAGLVATDHTHNRGRYYHKYGYRYRYRYAAKRAA